MAIILPLLDTPHSTSTLFSGMERKNGLARNGGITQRHFPHAEGGRESPSRSSQHLGAGTTTWALHHLPSPPPSPRPTMVPHASTPAVSHATALQVPLASSPLLPSVPCHSGRAQEEGRHGLDRERGWGEEGCSVPFYSLDKGRHSPA